MAPVEFNMRLVIFSCISIEYLLPTALLSSVRSLWPVSTGTCTCSFECLTRLGRANQAIPPLPKSPRYIRVGRFIAGLLLGIRFVCRWILPKPTALLADWGRGKTAYVVSMLAAAGLGSPFSPFLIGGSPLVRVSLLLKVLPLCELQFMIG